MKKGGNKSTNIGPLRFLGDKRLEDQEICRGGLILLP